MIKENILGQRTRKRKRIKENRIPYYQEYNFEILVLGLFALGFFLLWEKWHIKSIELPNLSINNDQRHLIEIYK